MTRIVSLLLNHREKFIPRKTAIAVFDATAIAHPKNNQSQSMSASK